MSASTQTIEVGSQGPAGAPGGSSTAPACPERYTETQAVLHGMFMEEAGSHVLDSGDLYGRNGDAYRASPDLLAKPRIAPYVDEDEGNKDGGSRFATRSSFHTLDSCLEYSAELDEKFARFCAANDDGRKNWTQLAHEFAADRDGGFSEDSDAHNTYWFENPMDAPFQWVEFDAFVAGGEPGERRQCRAVLVQVHLGCDIRGGYGRPRAFIMRHGEWLRHSVKSFCAECKCTQIECFKDGVVHNETAASECEACMFSEDQECEGQRGEDCICDKYPSYWRASGRPDGSIRCEECGGEVEVDGC